MIIQEMALLVHVIQYRLNLSEITDTDLQIIADNDLYRLLI